MVSPGDSSSQSRSGIWSAGSAMSCLMILKPIQIWSASVMGRGWRRPVSLATHPRVIPRSCCRICPIKLSSPPPPSPDQILITGKLIFLPQWVTVGKQFPWLSGPGKLKSTENQKPSLTDGDYTLVLLTGCSGSNNSGAERVETLLSISSHVNLPIPLHLRPTSLSVWMSGRAKPVISTLEIAELVLGLFTCHRHIPPATPIITTYRPSSPGNSVPSTPTPSPAWRRGTTRVGLSWNVAIQSLILQMSSCNSLVLLRSYSPWHWIATSQQINL